MAKLDKLSVSFYSLGMVFLLNAIFLTPGSFVGVRIAMVFFAAGYITNKYLNEE